MQQRLYPAQKSCGCRTLDDPVPSPCMLAVLATAHSIPIPSVFHASTSSAASGRPHSAVELNQEPNFERPGEELPPANTGIPSSTASAGDDPSGCSLAVAGNADSSLAATEKGDTSTTTAGDPFQAAAGGRLWSA